MKIVMTVSNPFKPDPRVYKEAKSLVKVGHEVYVIGWDREGKYPRCETVEGIKILRLGPRSRYGYGMVLGLPWFYLNAFKTILKLNPDVIHTHDFDTAILGFVLKFIMGTKWLYDIHDLYFTFFSMENEKETFLGKIVKVFDLLFARHATHVIVATQSIGGKHEGLREYYLKNNIPPDNITTIWNTPEIETFLNYLNLDLKKSNKFTIGFIGSIRTVSNFILLFEALSEEPWDYKLLFVGGGKDKENLKRIVKAKYPEFDVEFIENVDYRVIPNYYKLCDVVFSMFPMGENVRRGISVKVFEAAMLGVHSIVNRGTLNEDFVKMYGCGVSADLSPESIRKVIKHIRNRKKPFNTKVIREKWSWSKMEAKLRGLYATLR